MTEEKKELATTGGDTAPAIVEEHKDLANLYGNEDDDFTSQDLLISRLLLAQSQSQYVTDGKAKPGQIVGSLEHELQADIGETIEFIPFFRNKTFRLFKPVPGGGTPKFITEVPYSADTKPWETGRKREVDWTYTNPDGVEVTEKLKVFITWNYYVLLTNDFEGLPRVISFASTSYMAGRMLGSFIQESQKQRLPMPFKTYRVGTEFVQNDKGRFYKFVVSKGPRDTSGAIEWRNTTDEELKNVKYWAELARKGSIRVDEAADEAHGSDDAVPTPTVEKGEVAPDAEY